MANFDMSISSHKYSREQIKNALQNNTEWDTSWKIQEQDIGVRSRGLDPTVLIAIVGATGTAAGTLIAGLFQLISRKKDEKIVFKSSTGVIIEFPANLSAKELDEKIQKLKQLEFDKYQILLP